MEAKKAMICEIYTGIMAEHGTVMEYLPLDRIYDSRWENSTTTQKAITEAITAHVEHVEKDLDTIRAMESEFEDKGLRSTGQRWNCQMPFQTMRSVPEAERGRSQNARKKRKNVKGKKQNRKRRLPNRNTVVPATPAEPIGTGKKEEFVEPRFCTNAIRYELSLIRSRSHSLNLLCASMELNSEG